MMAEVLEEPHEEPQESPLLRQFISMVTCVAWGASRLYPTPKGRSKGYQMIPGLLLRFSVELKSRGDCSS